MRHRWTYSCTLAMACWMREAMTASPDVILLDNMVHLSNAGEVDTSLLAEAVRLVARGGGWASVAENCRSGYRDSFSSRTELDYLGYRIVIRKRPLDTDEE